MTKHLNLIVDEMGSQCRSFNTMQGLYGNIRLCVITLATAFFTHWSICGTACTLSIANSTLINLLIVSWLILFYFILFSNVFCILVHDYNLCFGSPCYNVGCDNYICI